MLLGKCCTCLAPTHLTKCPWLEFPLLHGISERKIFVYRKHVLEKKIIANNQKNTKSYAYYSTCTIEYKTSCRSNYLNLYELGEQLQATRQMDTSMNR